jgi:hypothetical protein
MVVLFITDTGLILGHFTNFAEANAYHDEWCERWEDSTFAERPSCTFFKYD